MKTFYVGVKGIITDQAKRVLLLRRDLASGEFWDMPGGRMDEAEDFQDTLMRELNEELPGIQVQSIGGLLGAYRVHKDIDGDVSLILLYFAVRAVLPSPVQVSEEHDGYLWVDTSSGIPEEVNGQVKSILKDMLPE